MTKVMHFAALPGRRCSFSLGIPMTEQPAVLSPWMPNRGSRPWGVGRVAPQGVILLEALRTNRQLPLRGGVVWPTHAVVALRYPLNLDALVAVVTAAYRLDELVIPQSSRRIKRREAALVGSDRRATALARAYFTNARFGDAAFEKDGSYAGRSSRTVRGFVQAVEAACPGAEVVTASDTGIEVKRIAQAANLRLSAADWWKAADEAVAKALTQFSDLKVQTSDIKWVV